MASPWTNKHWKNVLAHYKHSRMFMDMIENMSARRKVWTGLARLTLVCVRATF
jgi:hypothetical protein